MQSKANIAHYFQKTKKTATENFAKCIMKMVLCISRGKCRVRLWREIIIIIRKTASTFHNTPHKKTTTIMSNTMVAAMKICLMY